MVSRIIQTSDLTYNIICSLSQSCETIPLRRGTEEQTLGTVKLGNIVTHFEQINFFLKIFLKEPNFFLGKKVSKFRT
jgi:hypothetical protein